MREMVEPRVRRVVADTLGVDDEALGPEVSLLDDLAADSLDLVEIAVGLENELGIALPERVLDGVRTYGDLVGATLALARVVRHADPAPAGPAPSAWVRLVAPAARRSGALLRAERLTPYALASLADDARAAGRGARLDVTLAPETTDASLAGVRADLAPLERWGVALRVERDLPARPSRAAS